MRIAWDEAFRIISSRYPFVGIYDAIADPDDLPAIVALEQRTNDRLRDELGDISLVRAADRVSGPGTTPIMSAFTHARPSRFGDGSYGVYYAARRRESAIAETVFHLEAFYRATREASTDADMRVYVAVITGRFADLATSSPDDARLDPYSYAASQSYARALHDADRVDGIAYPSVRDERHGPCVACFRPRSVSACRTHGYLMYRYDGPRGRVVEVFERARVERVTATD